MDYISGLSFVSTFPTQNKRLCGNDLRRRKAATVVWPNHCQMASVLLAPAGGEQIITLSYNDPTLDLRRTEFRVEVIFASCEGQARDRI